MVTHLFTINSSESALTEDESSKAQSLSQGVRAGQSTFRQSAAKSATVAEMDKGAQVQILSARPRNRL
jgi:hypothetical protein